MSSRWAPSIGLVLVVLCACSRTRTTDAPPIFEEAPSLIGVSGGVHHTCAWSDDGRVFCFGSNAEGQLGIGSDPRVRTHLTTVAMGERVAEVSAGSNFTCARIIDGTVRCFGANDRGQLGDGTGGVNAAGGRFVPATERRGVHPRPADLIAPRSPPVIARTRLDES
jgi:hypothetical protein